MDFFWQKRRHRLKWSQVNHSTTRATQVDRAEYGMSDHLGLITANQHFNDILLGLHGDGEQPHTLPNTHATRGMDQCPTGTRTTGGLHDFLTFAVVDNTGYLDDIRQYCDITFTHIGVFNLSSDSQRQRFLSSPGLTINDELGP